MGAPPVHEGPCAHEVACATALTDMARVVLRHGKDADMKRLAESIIAAQEAEIAQLRTFLAR